MSDFEKEVPPQEQQQGDLNAEGGNGGNGKGNRLLLVGVALLLAAAIAGVNYLARPQGGAEVQSGAAAQNGAESSASLCSVSPVFGFTPSIAGTSRGDGI